MSFQIAGVAALQLGSFARHSTFFSCVHSTGRFCAPAPCRSISARAIAANWQPQRASEQDRVINRIRVGRIGLSPWLCRSLPARTFCMIPDDAKGPYRTVTALLYGALRHV